MKQIINKTIPLSIIVPVYGVEKYIRNCILSIINQEDELFNIIELIIVNDGTKDKSIELIQDLVSKYDNIILISQANQGLASARNNGMKVANGEYIWFVDSDDWISSISIKTLLPFLDGINDSVVFGAEEYWNDQRKKWHIYFQDVIVMDGKETFRNKCAQIATSVLAVYKLEFLRNNHIEFLSGILHEDNEFCPRVSYLSKCTTYLPNPIYCIRRATNDGRKSITTTINPKRSFDLLISLDSLLKFSKYVVTERDIQLLIDKHFLCIGLTTAMDVIMNCEKEQKRQFNKIYYEQYRGLTIHLANGLVKNQVESLFFRLFPKHVVECYAFLSLFNPRIWKRKIESLNIQK